MPRHINHLRTILAFVAALIPAATHAQQYDILLRGGRVLDGSGNPWYYADVAITGDRIVAVGDLRAAQARRVIDARGLYVAPGFIDVHSHAGGGLATAELSGAQPLLAQGITTAAINPDGGGPIDLARQKEQLLRDGLGVNVVQLMPHGSVRSEVIGSADRAATPAELERMKQLVRTGMQAGAFGLSSGPYYAPGSFASTEELIELAKVAAEFGGVYTSHIRDESDYTIGVVAAVDEVIRIAREAKLPGIVSHMKALGPRVWGYSSALVKRVERAREEGVQVFGDQYPYDASSTGLSSALLPRWAEAGGGDSLRARLRDPATRARIRAEMVENLDRRGGAARIQFTGGANRAGRTLAQVAADRNVDPIDAALQLFETGGAGSIVSFNMHEDDIKTLMRQPWMMTSSDGGLQTMGSGVPHPRQYGTYPRKLRKYVVEENVVDLAFAIRSMTSLPATVFNIRDRGVLRPGAFADIVIFDLARVRDLATYAEPHKLSEGMVHVLVNGRLAVDSGSFARELHGRVLSRRDPAM
jgi:N-acyl-D-aspartate/D-glutamate deacylase